MPFSIDTSNPADDSIVALFPANERAHRQNLQDWRDVEHGDDGRHTIGVGDTSARDAAISAPAAGNAWWNSVAEVLEIHDGSDWLRSKGGALFGTLAERNALNSDDLTDGILFVVTDAQYLVYVWDVSSASWKLVPSLGSAFRQRVQQGHANKHSGSSNDTVEIVQGASGDLTASRTVPSKGTWAFRVRARFPWQQGDAPGADRDHIAGLRIVYDPDGSDTGPTNTDLWLGFGRAGNSGGGDGSTHSFDELVTGIVNGEDYEFKLLYAAQAAATLNVGGPGVTIGGQVTVGCVIEAVLEPFGS